MTTALLAQLRRRFPGAEIVMAMPPAFVPLYRGRPFGIQAVGFRPTQPDTLETLLATTANKGFCWAILPGDNRFSWLAQALDARWISGWAADQPFTKNLLLDDPCSWPPEPGALADLWAVLAGQIEGSASSLGDLTFSENDWPAPSFEAFDVPSDPYAVLHVGASNPRKFWPADHWIALARSLEAEGYSIVLSAGKSEEALASACNPDGRWRNLAGQLDLAQMWQLIRGAGLLVAPDTGIAHLAKLTGTPTIALFGAGPTPLYARGQYFQHQPFLCAVLDELPARPQKSLFKREFSWLPALSGTRHSQSDIHYGRGPGFILELLHKGKVIS